MSNENQFDIGRRKVYMYKPDSQFFSRETIGELRKSSRFLIVGLFSAVLRSWYPSSPPPTRVLRDVAKESKQPLNWDAQTQWWIFAYCCLYLMLSLF